MITYNDIIVESPKILIYKGYKRSISGSNVYDFKDWHMESFWPRSSIWLWIEWDIKRYVISLNIKLHKKEWIEQQKKDADILWIQSIRYEN